jgi:mannose-6-phosphate isomerase
MTVVNALCPAAIELPPNPVWRSYEGGGVLRRFRGGSATTDDHFPEDWLASRVKARNGVNSRFPDEGLSRVTRDGVPGTLAECLAAEPAFWWGEDGLRRGDHRGPGVLWKLLDSAVRLHIQAHPTAEFARRRLNSNAGKTECWYIISTRGEGYVHLGFQRPPPRAAWEQMISNQRLDEMRACFDRIPVRAGDCYVVPAGTPHAIGEGVFMLELQEPTDWVVRCEFSAGGFSLPPESCFMGLDLATCMDVFDFSQLPVAEVRSHFQQHPRVVAESPAFRDEEIIGAPYHGFFRLQRLSGAGGADWPGGELMMIVVLKGRAVLTAGGVEQPVRAGQTWALPGSARQWHWREPAGDWEVLLAKLPRP